MTLELRKRYGNNNVVAGYRKTQPSVELAESGPLEVVDATDIVRLAEVVKKYKIDTIYNLAALLSAVAEKNPQAAWNVGVNGAYNVWKLPVNINVLSFPKFDWRLWVEHPPLDNTPQDTIQRPGTMYGVTKVAAELLSDYYFKRFGVDTRGVRFPGIISNVTLPGGGTTDYAVEIYYAAIKDGKYTCPLRKGTFLDMMYMPDALDAAIDLMEADPSKLKHRNCFNITAMSFDPPDIIYNSIKYIPNFKMDYDVDPVKQGIAESWPNKMDDSAAREEWGMEPKMGPRQNDTGYAKGD